MDSSGFEPEATPLQDEILVTATDGAISAVGAVFESGGSTTLRIAAGGSINISGAALTASSMQSCLPTATTPTHKLILSATTLLDDSNDKMAVKIGGTACTTSSGTYTNYVTNYASYAAKVEA